MPTMTVDDLLVKVRDAERKMSRKNPHKLLMRQIQDALIQLAVRVGELSQLQESQHATLPTSENAVGRIVIP